MERKAYKFEGVNGVDVVEIPVPEDMKAKVEEFRNKLVEKVAEADDSLIEKFLAGEELSIEEIKAGIRKLTISAKLYPVFCGTALGNKGVQLMLDGVINYLPSPKDVPDVLGHTKDGDPLTLRAEEDGPFCALAFKIQTDPYVGRLTYIRVYSGKLASGSYVLNSTKGSKERIGRILLMHANRREEVKEIFIK